MRLPAGTAASLVRRLGGQLDPLRLHAGLLGEEGASPPLFIQRTGGPAIIVEAAAVQAVCRKEEVELIAFTESGSVALVQLEKVLGDHVTERGERRLTARFARCMVPEEFERAHARTPFDVLRALAFGHRPAHADEPFAVTAAGVVGFDHVDLFEELPEAPAGDFPDFVFWLAESLIVVEQGGATRILCTAFGSDDEAIAHRQYSLAQERLSRLAARCEHVGERPFTVAKAVTRNDTAVETDLDDDAYAALVSRLKDNVEAGDVFQVVPSRAFRTACAEPAKAFARLGAADPSRYLFYADTGFGTLFGASPETAVAVRREGDDRLVMVSPIAGTRPRGATVDEDDRMEADLRLDVKEVAEHMMLVDLARNDVARVAEPGTRRIAGLLTVERFARVMHLVSRVEGRLEPDRDAIDALIACGTCGTLSGAPKLRAIELIRSAEVSPRGPYGGAIGWIASDGTMDTSIVIRSALVRNGIAEVRAGAGVVHDSDPAAEAAETRHKASAVLAAIRAAA
jgi:anthranilate synthase component 1